jgi:hypothetical protein
MQVLSTSLHDQVAAAGSVGTVVLCCIAPSCVASGSLWSSQSRRAGCCSSFVFLSLENILRCYTTQITCHRATFPSACNWSRDVSMQDSTSHRLVAAAVATASHLVPSEGLHGTTALLLSVWCPCLRTAPKHTHAECDHSTHAFLSASPVVKPAPATVM